MVKGIYIKTKGYTIGMNYSEKIKEKLSTLLKTSTPEENQQLYQQICTYESSIQGHSIWTSFFSTHILYFNQTTGLFVWQQNQYSILTENDVIHLIWKHLNQYPIHTSLKQQIKQKIMRSIKDRSIYNTIPHSVTLQEVISFLHPLLFPTKSGSKYFMTILGDILLKKTNLYYFMDPSMKPFIQKLQKILTLYFITTHLAAFKFKYHDHEPELSRIIKTNPINVDYLKCDEPFYLNLICCSIHYSNRYTHGDKFLEDVLNTSLRKEVMWIKETNKEDLLQEFIRTYLSPSDTYLHEKDMIFLWKMFVKEKHSINFSKNLQEDLSRILIYQPPYFLNITSMRMPYVKKFIQFWKKSMYSDPTEQYLELTEVLSLFIENHMKYSDITESKIKEILFYYFPDLILHEDRYIHYTGCTLWNKKEELRKFGHNRYEDYANSSMPRKVSKVYFESYWNKYLNVV
jgi:hypothetical protein